MRKQGQQFTFELAPVHSENREEREKQRVVGSLRALNHAAATQAACEKAEQLTKERGIEYGVVRVY